LLSKWSKLLARNQVIKKPNGVRPSSDGHKDLISQRQACILFSMNNLLRHSFSIIMILIICRIGQFVGSESWHSNIDVPVSVFLYMSQLATPFQFAYFLAGSFLLSGRLSFTFKRMSGQLQVLVGCW